MNPKELISKPEINFLLSILIPLTALSVSWGVLNQRMDHLERMTTGLQNQYDIQRVATEDIKVKLAEIQKDILYIREKFDDHDK